MFKIRASCPLAHTLSFCSHCPQDSVNCSSQGLWQDHHSVGYRHPFKGVFFCYPLSVFAGGRSCTPPFNFTFPCMKQALSLILPSIFKTRVKILSDLIKQQRRWKGHILDYPKGHFLAYKFLLLCRDISHISPRMFWVPRVWNSRPFMAGSEEGRNVFLKTKDLFEAYS